MKTSSWLSILVAAALVLVAGALLALAGPGGEVAAGQRVMVKLDDTVETVELEELADGESRELEAGEHTVTVTRRGDRLDVLLDGKELGAPCAGCDGLDKMVWVGKGEGGEPAEHRVVVLKGGAAGSEDEALRTVVMLTRGGAGDEEVEVDVEALEGCDTAKLRELVLSDAKGGAACCASAGTEGEPVVVMGPGRRPGMVRYRCEANGSELLVPKEAALADSYVCPATGCVMTWVEEPEVRIIKVVKTVKESDTEPTE